MTYPTLNGTDVLRQLLTLRCRSSDGGIRKLVEKTSIPFRECEDNHEETRVIATIGADFCRAAASPGAETALPQRRSPGTGRGFAVEQSATDRVPFAFRRQARRDYGVRVAFSVTPENAEYARTLV